MHFLYFENSRNARFSCCFLLAIIFLFFENLARNSYLAFEVENWYAWVTQLISFSVTFLSTVLSICLHCMCLHFVPFQIFI